MMSVTAEVIVRCCCLLMFHAPQFVGLLLRGYQQCERGKAEPWQCSFEKHHCILKHFSQTGFLTAYGVFLEILKLKLQHLKGTYQKTEYTSKR